MVSTTAQRHHNIMKAHSHFRGPAHLKLMNIHEWALESGLVTANGKVARCDDIIFFLTLAHFAMLGTQVVFTFIF
jgi:hypothetical protein